MSVHRQLVNQPLPAAKEIIADTLAEARARTLLLIEPLSDEDLLTQHDPLMSPIMWDIGHIAHFEELWLTRNLGGKIEFAEMPGIYNPFENPRSRRGTLPLEPRDRMLSELDRIRTLVLERLEKIELDDANPLLRGAFVYNMVLQHEYQHNETILQTLQLKKGSPYPAPRTVRFDSAYAENQPMVDFPGGDLTLGTNDTTVAYDNERPRHTVTLPPFRIDRTPVTNGDYLEFIRDKGYKREACWSVKGREWLRESGADAPKYWTLLEGAWHQRVMDILRPVDPARPVCHVCFYEAEAFASWAGKRLPTEAEWEAAASWDHVGKCARLYPWGDSPPAAAKANLDQLAFDTAPVSTFQAFTSPSGCVAMMGDVWEWTSTDFHGYPGFTAFPYSEYSEVFFGNEYKILRGGSWATRPGAVRNTFRNWDYPVRRQIFSGFRCAQDA